jgi:hypothetical protein
MTTVISRARQPGASVALVGGDLLIGDWNSAAVIPLSLPLRSTQLPNGTLIGAYGRSGLLLNAQDAQVCSLDDGSLIASIPLSDLQAPKKEGLIEENAGSTWISGVVNGRLAWLSGPGGVLTLDLDRCEVVDRQAWAQDWSVAPGDVANWLLGGAIISSNNPYGTNIERLPVGVVSEGLAVLPVGSQRLVALQAGAPVPKNTTPAGGSDGR